MNVFSDVHADRYWLQSAVVAMLQTTHKDHHKVASTIDTATLIPSRSDHHTQVVVSKCCIVRNKNPLGILTDNNCGSFSSIPSSHNFRLLGCRKFHPPMLNVNRSIKTFGSILTFITKFFTNFPSITIFWTNFFIHHNVLNQFFIQHDVLHQFSIYHNLLVTFSKFSNFSHPSESSDYF